MVDHSRHTTASPSPSIETPIRLVLRFGEQQFVLGQQAACCLTMGREKGNDLVAPQKFVSRRHATIECVRDRFVFTDTSANGTYIQPAGQDMMHIQGAKVFLEGTGVFSLGLHLDQPEALRVEYALE
ncbi:MAG: FHA domain-containing protein [Desulfovibrio sp.]|nr:FHA domain-containing protein [Desulfovibrio sp.]MCA1986865.1 FHA domain-containing protein [Desulfovibrio sp.]